MLSLTTLGTRETFALPPHKNGCDMECRARRFESKIVNAPLRVSESLTRTTSKRCCAEKSHQDGIPEALYARGAKTFPLASYAPLH